MYVLGMEVGCTQYIGRNTRWYGAKPVLFKLMSPSHLKVLRYL